MERKGDATFYSWEEYGSKFSVGKLHFKHFSKRENQETGEVWDETTKFWYIGISPYTEGKKAVVKMFFSEKLKEEIGGDEESFWALVEANLISVVTNDKRKDIRLSLKS